MHSLFQTFCEMMDRLPAAAAKRAAAAERRSLDEGAISVLTFRRFLNAVMLGVPLTHGVLPAEHVSAYRKSVARLVKAGRLPTGADKEFDRTFSGG